MSSQPRGYNAAEPPALRSRRPPEPRSPPGPAPGSGGAMSRATMFQDEKRRIISSCFSKMDSDGVLTESYITHIRVTEDAAYPSTPAPPNSPPENKKPRVIIVALRKSGRVRMHKARENNDSTFSIGKTWMLDDLSAIQVYDNLTPTSPLEQQQKQWASNVGVIVTIGKAYYWQTANYKERDFFIGSLVKIFKKYTGGKVPRLIGFDEKQRYALAGDAPEVQQPSQPSQAQQPPPSRAGRSPSRDPEARAAPRPRASEDQLSKPQAARDLAHRPSPSTARSVPNLRDGTMPRVNGAEGGRYASPSTAQRDPMPTSTPGYRAPSRGREERPPPSRDGVGPDVRQVPHLDVTPDPSRPATSGSGTGAVEQRGLMPESRPSSRQSAGLGSAPPSRGGDQSTRSSLDIPPSLRPASSGSTTSTPGVDSSRTETEPSHMPSEPISPISRATESTTLSIRDTKPAPLDKREEPAGPSQSAEPVAEPAQKPVAEPDPKPAVEPAAEPAAEEPSSKSPEKPAEDQPEEDEPEETHRPGLGPMVKKKPARDVAGVFRKAATAYGAFKPRAGGAGERLLALAKKAKSNEPDGITSVVPAPALRALNTDSAKSSTPAAQSTPSDQAPAKIEVTPAPDQQAESNGVEAKDTSAETQEPPQSPAPERRRKRLEDNAAKYCQALDIDPSLLDSRAVEFDEILSDLGWSGRLGDEKKIEDLEADIRREIGRVQATSWLGNVEQQEGKIDHLARMIDKVIQECEELDGLLTLYAHELGTLHEDVAYIEAQSQGLQVQTANQKLLQSELQSLLKTLSISHRDLQPLKEASLDSPQGIKETEAVLSMLYKAMLTIDSDVHQNKKRMGDAASDHGSIGVYADSEVGQMRAVLEKKNEYRAEATAFLQRLRQYMSIAFKLAEQKRSNAAANAEKDPLKLNDAARDVARKELWPYNALMLFAREISSTEWSALINLYEQDVKIPYQSEFREHSASWKRAAKKASGEEYELLFTNPEKDDKSEGLTTAAARKLTVRRGKTVRLTPGSRSLSDDKGSGKYEPFEVFSGFLSETTRVISREQNFVVRFFHMDSLSNTEFSDIVAESSPEDRQVPDLGVKRSHDPDRDLAKKVEQIMDGIYSFWTVELQNMLDWVIKMDQLQGVGVLAALESTISEYEDTNQDFLVHALQKLRTRLNGLFNRFVDEQVRAIEETKVKVNKRKGVISFMRTFPNFSAAIENILTAQSASKFSDVRVLVNEAYERINRAMWESLKFIAKEAPGQSGAAGDPEDKEVLNYHILLIENMNHYIEEVDDRGLQVLERWRDRARQDYQEHMKLYLDSVIHRPLGKLLDFIESTETLVARTSHPPEVAQRPSHSKHVAKKLVAAYDAKELRRGADSLKKRVEKHFGDADDPGISRSLVMKVFKECEERYGDVYERFKRLAESVYENQIDLEWSKDEAMALFRRV